MRGALTLLFLKTLASSKVIHIFQVAPMPGTGQWIDVWQPKPASEPLTQR